MDWPKTPSGATDWELAFEDPKTGLIALVATAATPMKLRAVTELLVEQLFLRESDAVCRADYRRQLGAIFDLEQSIDELIPRVAEFLRDIKRARVARARAPRDGEATSARGEMQAGAPPDERPVEEIFAEVFRIYVRARFDIATSDLDATLMAAEKPPFILSPAFTDHFIGCLDRHFYPRLTNANRGSLVRAENQAPEARFAYLEEHMNEHRSRAVFVQTWAEVWKQLTQTKKLPPRPVEEKTGPLAKLFGKGAAKPVSVYRMKPQEWDAAVEANQRAKRIWADIIQDTGVYLCPTDDDNRFLMNMLGRTPGNLQSQIAAIAQILVQGGGRQTFDAYQNGRDIDLALLIAAYRHPDSMFGCEGFISKMLGDHPESFRRERYPLVSRYIFDTGKVPVETAEAELDT